MGQKVIIRFWWESELTSASRNHLITCAPLNSWISFSRENLIVTKVSLRKINSYQKSESTSVGRKVKFRRLYCDDCSKFGCDWTGDEQMPNPLCVVCGQKLSNETMVSSRLKRHFITNHSHLQTKTIVCFERLLQANSRQSKYFRKQWLCQNELN